MRSAAVILALGACLAAGCGDDGAAGAVGPVPPPPEPGYTEAQVMDAAGIVEGCDTGTEVTVGPCGSETLGTTEIPDGFPAWVHEASGCGIEFPLMSAEEVAMYADTGENVASNPARTVGVKLSTPEADAQRCHKTLTDVLASL